MENTTDIQTRIQVLLARLPLQALQGVLAFLESLVRQEEWKSEDRGSEVSTKYDFSDLVGQLSWRGDAVAMQQDLRNEW